MQTPLRITTWNPQPLRQIPYLNAAPGGGKTEVVRLEITTARATGLPAALKALVLTADLQGRERVSGPQVRDEPPLLGETLAHDLERLGVSALLPPADEVGVILAGDLWADPQSRKRGGLGDVAPVWNTFARSFRWVAGVLGNHDQLDRTSYASQHLLDGTVVTPDGLRIGGVGGIIGHKGKTGRKPEADFLRMLHEVLATKPDIVILHMGPDAPESDLRGSEVVRRALEEYPPTLVVCGHCHAHQPIHELANGTQVVNVDARVIVVQPAVA
jgi:Icc-related predicted phosphoesterase